MRQLRQKQPYWSYSGLQALVKSHLHAIHSQQLPISHSYILRDIQHRIVHFSRQLAHCTRFCDPTSATATTNMLGSLLCLYTGEEGLK